MAILLVKLLLVPLLLATVTIAGRRWGQSVAGWLGGFPIVAGPILLILTLENGNAFGARAAQTSLAGIGAAMIFYVAYARFADRAGWPASLAGALATWIASVSVIALLPDRLWVAAAVAVASLAAAPHAMGARPALLAGASPHPLELPARMLVGAGLTLLTSALGARLGADASGYAALFPVIGTVVAAFNHATHGAHAAGAFLYGMTRGMWSVGVFCLALVFVLPRLHVAPAFALAVAATVAMHALLRPRRRAG